MSGRPTLRIANEVGDDVGADNASKLDGIGNHVRDWRKVFVQGWQSGQQRKQRSRRGGLDDQPITVFAHDRVFAGKLELARNPHCLVSPVLEELDVPPGNDAFPQLT